MDWFLVLLGLVALSVLAVLFLGYWLVNAVAFCLGWLLWRRSGARVLVVLVSLVSGSIVLLRGGLLVVHFGIGVGYLFTNV